MVNMMAILHHNSIVSLDWAENLQCKDIIRASAKGEETADPVVLVLIE